ncbi:MAG: hypothetical protein JOZ92_07885 [Candidatus Dormibacteraeota bacterium]|nr:hypothetical protein [Mycolicibacterium sp.]MBV8445820.1 hypothetical protein [Candidatus Dormibacteraeota bacterium]
MRQIKLETPDTTWATEYHGRAVDTLRGQGRQIDSELLAHIWPTHHANVHFYGTHTIDIDGANSTPAAIGLSGHQPLVHRTKDGAPRPDGAGSRGEPASVVKVR